MHRTLVLDVVGLTPELIGQRTPNLARFARRGALRPLATAFPAVTCPVQATFTTGRRPAEHGIVGNGWYFRDLAEVWFWRQSHGLVASDSIWDEARARDRSFTAANLFWWFNMYSSVDVSVTPRPVYTADGLKIPDLYTTPATLRHDLAKRLGPFPLFRFWGPEAGILSSQWIARAAEHLMASFAPTLTLVYLPHLDYDFQRYGPYHPRSAAALEALDVLCGELLDAAERASVRVIVLSEYGITPVRGAVFPNRALRRAGLLRVREELGAEKLDAGASEAFAVADHQIAHVYVKRPERLEEVRELLLGLDGVERVLGSQEKVDAGLDHPRSGELVAVARHDRWFAYPYWVDDDRAPDFARTVDIHRKPGYDPLELFYDPALRFPKLHAGLRLAQKAAGLRYLMDVVPLDTGLVGGSHGRITDRPDQGPLIASTEGDLLPDRPSATDVRAIVLAHLFGSGAGDASLKREGEQAA
jgi:predicted AlkP superfamily pyrophosphatase or phosphodiesterase